MTSVIDSTTFEALKQMVGADFISELVTTFLEDGPRMLGELRDSLAANDAETFKRAAHSMKTNAATFGATELAELAKALEMFGRSNNLREVGNLLEVLNEAYEHAAAELKGLIS
jgi:HPt (histidine-containing phosphotransfer) domain-containing protein